MASSENSGQGFLGVRGEDVTPQIASAYNLGAQSGVLIVGFVPAANGSSPAQQAGLQQGDIITAVNGQTVSGNSDLASYPAPARARHEGLRHLRARHGYQHRQRHPRRASHLQRLTPRRARYLAAPPTVGRGGYFVAVQRYRSESISARYFCSKVACSALPCIQ